MKKELTGPKPGLIFALDLAEPCGCAEAVPGEAGGHTAAEGEGPASQGALRHSRRPWFSKSSRTAQPGTSKQSYSGLLCALGYASA